MKIYCDGASKGNPGLASIGISFQKNGKEVDTISKFIGICTNNVAEWKSLLAGLRRSIEFKELEIEVFMDSELVVKQAKGEYKVKSKNLKDLKEKFDIEVQKLSSFKISHILREKNKRADELANLGLKNRL